MNIQSLIEKYQGLIKKETDYLASPEGQSSPEDQRIFATQKCFFYQGFVDELEKVSGDQWISVTYGLPEQEQLLLKEGDFESTKQVLVLTDCDTITNNSRVKMYLTGKWEWTMNIHEETILYWQPLPTAPTI